MFFHSLSQPGSGVDIEQLVIDLPEPMDVPLFEHAWQAIIQRHEVLRTSFAWESDERPFQQVHRTVAFSLATEDWSSWPSSVQQEKFAADLREDRLRGFDLQHPPLMRVRLLRLAPDRYRMVWSFHHIILDGRSLSTILREVFALYEDPSVSLASPPPSYFEYVQWLQSQDNSQPAGFWKEKLQGILAPTPLYADSSSLPSAPGAIRYGELELSLSRSTSDELRRFAVDHLVTTNTLVMAAWAILLMRQSGLDDVVFDITKTARHFGLPRADEMVGLFLNTLPMRISAQPEAELSVLLAAVRMEWLSLRAGEHVPLVDIRQASSVPTSQPLSETLVVFENNRFSTELRELGGRWVHRDMRLFEQTNYALTLAAYNDPEIVLKLEYDARRFSMQAIRRMLGHLSTLLESMPSGLRLPVRDLPWLTSTERQQLLVEWNDTERAYPAHSSLASLLDEQALKAPARVALVSGQAQLTYAELHSRANRLARYLQKLGVGPESLVGVHMHRTPDLLVALLGILKAGGAYVPLDPAFPLDRLTYIAHDAGLHACVTESALSQQASAFSGTSIALDADWPQITLESDTFLPCPAAPHNLIYVLYTSGSTGKPKGVEITHSAVLNFLHSMRERPGLAAEDRLLAITTISFDIAGLELYLPLMAGASIVLATSDAAFDGHALAQLLARHDVTVMQATPATWQMIVDTGWQGKSDLKILCGGEPLSPELATALLPRCSQLWNIYGPTETTIWSLVEPITSADAPILIGRPIANTDVYILDKAGHPVPVGVSGELLLGGAGLARGYHARPELTAEKFIPHPFSQQPGARLYRTGDLARYHSDGRIECLGRVDFQVKIRGFRIELGEIESQLAQHPGIARAVVVAREDRPGDRRLVAYFIPSPGSTIDTADLRTQLKRQLPDYMVPASFVEMQEFPLTPNKKVDRRALPAPDLDVAAAAAETYTPPTDSYETALCDMWASTLGLPRVGIHDNFFELGGHSLLAVRLLAKVLEKWPYHRLTIAAFLSAPTVAEFAEVIRSGAQIITQCLVPFRQSGANYPLFCIPGAGGNVVSLRNFGASFSQDQPLYCIQAKGLDGSEPCHSVRDHATHYLAEVRKIQPHGPYHIAGMCFGGLVAFELAHLLRECGETVALLALLDSYNPAFSSTLSSSQLLRAHASFYVRRSVHHFRRFLKLPSVDRWSYLKDRAAVLPRYISQLVSSKKTIVLQPDLVQVFDDLPAEHRGFLKEALGRVTVAAMEAGSQYQPPLYDGKVLVFSAADRFVEPFEDDSLGWRPFVKEVEVFELPGNHNNFLSGQGSLVTSRTIEVVTRAGQQANWRSESLGEP